MGVLFLTEIHRPKRLSRMAHVSCCFFRCLFRALSLHLRARPQAGSLALRERVRAPLRKKKNALCSHYPFGIKFLEICAPNCQPCFLDTISRGPMPLLCFMMWELFPCLSCSSRTCFWIEADVATRTSASLLNTHSLKSTY